MSKDELILKLIKECFKQWEDAHADHCGIYPSFHLGLCHWPLPDILRENLEIAQEESDAPAT